MPTPRDQPLEIFVFLFLCLPTGLGIVVSDDGPQVIEGVLPPGVYKLWGGILVVCSLLVGIAWLISLTGHQRLASRFEHNGLVPVAIASLAYAAAIYATNLVAGWYAAGTITGFGIFCAIRAARVQRRYGFVTVGSLLADTRAGRWAKRQRAAAIAKSRRTAKWAATTWRSVMS